jgi:TatA/E family protein of Tat protein translocase
MMQLLSVTSFGFLEFIGTTELLVVLFVALLIFGPRKLPQLGRSLGRALSQVRAASDDFKRTWEAEALTADGERVPASLPPAAAEAAGRPAHEAASGQRREA